MTNRERVKAILNYQPYDRMPVVHFGFWNETLEKWYHEGHITEEEYLSWGDGNEYDKRIGERLGFDFNWYYCFSPATSLFPSFEQKDVGAYPSGGRMMRNSDGVIVLQKDDAGSIPAEIDHLLTDRESWKEHYKWRLQFSPDRASIDGYKKMKEMNPDNPIGLHCGSLFGRIRDIMGVEGISYLYADDEDLYDEIIDTVGTLCCETVKYTLEQGLTFDFAHFWEDICFKNGPLVIPSVFREKVGPHYKRITDLLKEHGITIVSLDCDGCIDSLIPTWLENGVNTMFPIEVGTWNAEIAPWREKYGQIIRGVGGMNKNVFSQDKEAVDREVDRLQRLIKLGGYIPCPDHRIAPDAEWDNVKYYCEQMKKRL
ncbi:MAG: hypothetical protein KH828_00595 [Clostridiales bacterium]|nr:hypothetical protein [Clostridiales bacterium]